VAGLRQDLVEADVDALPEATYAPPEALSEPARSPEWLPYFQSLWEKRRIVFKVAMVALIVSAAVAFLIPKRYESTVAIMPPDSLDNSGMIMAALAGKGSPGLAGMASSLLGMKSSGALYIGLLHSRSVEDHIVDKFDLRKVYGTRYEQDARKILDHRTVVDEDRKSGVLTITVTDRRPERARDIAQSYVEELNALVSQVSTSSARRERIFIEQRLSTVKTDLESAEQQFSAFASKNTALDIKEQTKAMVQSAASLQGQLIAAQSELEGLLQIYSPNNVRVRTTQARVDELKRQLQKIDGTDASLTTDAPQSGDLYPSIRKLPLLGVQWADLYRRVKTQEAVYELLSQQYELARIQEAKEVPTVNVIDSANLPEKKSWPPRLLVMALLTSLAVAGVIAVIIGKEELQSLPEDDPYRQLAQKAGFAWRRYWAYGIQRVRRNESSMISQQEAK